MNIREELQSRILEPFAKIVFCDNGWLQLLEDLHSELIHIDPEYRVYQVKEKFGGLCFYYALSDPSRDPEIRQIVGKYEQKSFTICEKTGEPGSLKLKNGLFKTLNDSFLEDGWNQASRGANILRKSKNESIAK